MVYNYLEAKVSSISDNDARLRVLALIATGRQSFTATYLGNGKWQVSGYGLWNLYETSKTIEPANDETRAMLIFIQGHSN